MSEVCSTLLPACPLSCIGEHLIFLRISGDMNDTNPIRSIRTYVKVITELSGSQWSAWFEDLPQVSFGGQYPSAAIERLLEHVGNDQFDTDQIVSIDDATREGHLEFRIPLLHHRRIPNPSQN
jgi:hypothetical protein